jgi:hypothetical protein
MINDYQEALKILSSARDTLINSSKHYETQLQVQMIPGAMTALGIMSKKFNTDPDTMRLALQLGIYLTLRYQETQRLTQLYGDLR